MDNSGPQTFKDIQWQKLWERDRNSRSWSSKGAKDWDQKAPSFAERNRHSPYIPLVMARLPLTPATTVLDVGSGPGTLSLPLAGQVDKVTAIDYSRSMLDLLDQQAIEKGYANIHTIHCSWEDDWQKMEVGSHDLAIASRSMNVADPVAAIKKLEAHSRKYIFISDRIDPTPFDPLAFDAIGRDFRAGPDYIYTINFLYSMGIHANVEIVELDNQMIYTSYAELQESYYWMFKELSDTEKNKLDNYLQGQIISSTPGRIVFKRAFPPRWALIWWQKDR